MKFCNKCKQDSWQNFCAYEQASNFTCISASHYMSLKSYKRANTLYLEKRESGLYGC